ncbi:DUF1893 domain-containing protein [candidate division WOR-3 bacterium]|nr:DUF1893 domain-containing protein [candidate division WOR-3 bacterium]
MLETAAERTTRLLALLEPAGLSLLVLKHGKEVFRSALPGVHPLLELVGRFPDGLDGALVVDRVVGGCAARVFVYLGAGDVVAGTMSEAGRAILEAAPVRFSFAALVPEVRSRTGDSTCPFELLSGRHADARALLDAIRARLAAMSRDKS